jgi:SAM-dependent methyltransferase
MSDSMNEVLDRAFGHPRGLLGRLGGALMTHANAATELHVVAVTRLTEAETVLIVGRSTGAGVDAATRRAARVITVETVDTAEGTELDAESVDVALSVNNVQLWTDRQAGFAELFRVLRPGGRLLLSGHEKWLPVPRHALAAEVEAAGFVDLQTWRWEPPGPFAAMAAQLRAVRP